MKLLIIWMVILSAHAADAPSSVWGTLIEVKAKNLPYKHAVYFEKDGSQTAYFIQDTYPSTAKIGQLVRLTGSIKILGQNEVVIKPTTIKVLALSDLNSASAIPVQSGGLSLEGNDQKNYKAISSAAHLLGLLLQGFTGH